MERSKPNQQQQQVANNDQHHDIINALSYPREVTIASTPIKLNRNSLKSKTGLLTNSASSSSSMHSSSPKPAKTLHKSRTEYFDSKSTSLGGAYINSGFDLNQTSNTSVDNTTSSSSSSSSSANSFESNLAGAPAPPSASSKINLRRESSQLLPQSIVSQMARNFQSLAYTHQQKMR